MFYWYTNYFSLWCPLNYNIGVLLACCQTLFVVGSGCLNKVLITSIQVNNHGFFFFFFFFFFVVFDCDLSRGFGPIVSTCSFAIFVTLVST